MNYIKMYAVILCALLSYSLIESIFNFTYLFIEHLIKNKKRLKSGGYIHEDNNS